jgi:hypothetical protein
MAMFGSSWKQEESNEESYNKITGSKYSGRSSSELRKDIEKSINDPYSSKTERNALRDLLNKLNNND